MDNCNMCGVEAELVDVIVEGTMLSVCRRCASFGDAVKVERSEVIRKPRKIVVEEEAEFIVEGCSGLVKEGRERMDWKQEELARRIGERESVVAKIEGGHMKPSRI